MARHLIILLSVFILLGCENTTSSDIDADLASEADTLLDVDSDLETQSEQDVNTDSDADSTTETENEQQSTTDVDYSLISCVDELQQVLTLVNTFRSTEQTCGSTLYPAVSALTWNEELYLAAKEHADNMANYNFFSHTGLDDSSVGSRVSAQGYTWSYVAENIAAGQTSAENVVNAWMNSEGHCKNMMSDNATEMALACTVNNDADYRRYWVQVFAKPF